MTKDVKTSQRWYVHAENFISSVQRTTLLQKSPTAVKRFFVWVSNWVGQFGDLEWLRNEDPKDPTRNVLLPENERLDLPIIWVCEMYPPSYAEELAKNVKRKGWHDVFGADAPGDQFDEYLNKVRTQDQLGWRSVGRVYSPESKQFRPPRSIVAKLPTEFVSVHIDFFALGTALSSLVASFYLSEYGSKSLERAVTMEHNPRVIFQNGSRSLQNRTFTGISDVEAARHNLHTKGREWMRKNFPGIFSEEGDGQLPTADLIVRSGSKETVIYSQRNCNYLDALGLRETIEGSSSTLPGVFFSEYNAMRSGVDARNIWNLHGEFKQMLPDSTLAFNGERTTHGIAYGVDRTFKPLLTRLAITSLLRLKLRNSAMSRDLARKTHGRNPTKSSQVLRDSLLRHSLDLVAVASDVKALAADLGVYSWSVPHFKTGYARWIKKRSPKGSKNNHLADRELLEELREGQTRMANSLVERDSEAREILSTAVTLNFSLVNIRTQRLSIVLSVVAVGIAIATLFLTRTQTG